MQQLERGCYSYSILIKKFESAYLRRFKKDPIESLSSLEKILQVYRQDPMQSHKILQEFYGIRLSSANDPRVL